MKFFRRNNLILIFIATILTTTATMSKAVDPQEPLNVQKKEQINEDIAPNKQNLTATNPDSAIKNDKIKKNKLNVTTPAIPLAKTISGILIVFGFIAVIVIVMKKYGNKFGIGNFANNIVTVKARQQLDAKNSISVVKVYEDEYVLAVGNNGVTLLSKLTPIAESELFANNASEELPEFKKNDSKDKNNAPFESQLKSFISNKNTAPITKSEQESYSPRLDNAVNDSVSLNISTNYDSQKDEDKNDKA